MYAASAYPSAMKMPFRPTKKPRSFGGASSVEYTGATNRLVLVFSVGDLVKTY